MTWSYSRLTAFDSCRYAWFLKYIKCLPKVPNFYSQYGKFMHEIFQLFDAKEISKDEAIIFYIEKFDSKVTYRPQKRSTYVKYYLDGLEAVKKLEENPHVLEVESEYNFEFDGKPAIAFVDRTLKDDGLIIDDHKSAEMKPKSGRSKPTQLDLELEERFKQLYFYAIPVSERYGELPKLLRLNSFRKQIIVDEMFDLEKYEQTKEWARSKIKQITENEDWKPSEEYFRCNFLCDMREHCEYHMN